jgi:hypothetical protein
LLAGCQHNPLNADSDWFSRVSMPVAPDGEAQCDDDGDGASEPCLSQRQVDHLFNATIDALCEANDRIARLSDYYLNTSLGPSCEPS